MPLTLAAVGAAGLFAAVPGCRVSSLFQTPEAPQVTAQVGPPGAPGRQSIRVSQYVFYTDLDLDEDAPIFQELSDLREEVTRELRLPPGEIPNGAHLSWAFRNTDKWT